MTISVVHTTTAFTTSPTIPATTAGNCLVVCIMSDTNTASISGITLGGSAGNFAQLISPVVGANCTTNIWADPNCAGGQTAIVISGTNLGIGSVDGGLTVYEISGLAATIGALLDKSSPGTGTAVPNWSSGTTAATTKAAEAWVGAALVFGGSIVGPSSPWTNVTPTGDCISGVQVTSSTGTATYAGTGGGGFAAAVVTLAPGVSSGSEPMSARGWVMSGFDANTEMLGAEGISGA